MTSIILLLFLFLFLLQNSCENESISYKIMQVLKNLPGFEDTVVEPHGNRFTGSGCCKEPPFFVIIHMGRSQAPSGDKVVLIIISRILAESVSNFLSDTMMNKTTAAAEEQEQEQISSTNVQHNCIGLQQGPISRPQ